MAKISLSDSTIKTPRDELAKNIECQILKKFQASLLFLIQSYGTTDVLQLSQLLAYFCFN